MNETQIVGIITTSGIPDPSSGQVPFTQMRSVYRIYQELRKLTRDSDAPYEIQLLNFVPAGIGNNSCSTIKVGKADKTFEVTGGDMLSLSLAVGKLLATHGDEQPLYKVLVAGTLETARLAVMLRANGIAEKVVFVANHLLRPLNHWAIPINSEYLEIEAQCLEEIDALIFPSESQREQFLTYYSPMSSLYSECLLNGVSRVYEKSDDVVAPAHKNKKWTSTAILFMASPVHSQSDYQTALYALRRIIAGFAGKIILRVAGPPKLDSIDFKPTGELRKIIDTAIQLNILGNIEFLGQLSPKQMQKQYRDADITLVSSVLETFGDVASESLYEQTPIVATKTGAIELFVKDIEQGYTVPPRSPWEFAEKIIKLLSIVKNKDYERSDAISYQVRRLTWSVTAEKYIRLFNNILNPRQVRKNEQLARSNKVRELLRFLLQTRQLSIRKLTENLNAELKRNSHKEKSFESVRRIFDRDASPNLRWRTIEPIARLLCKTNEYLKIKNLLS
jgi:glycosyltransferase involved in cell wall biosynthesis